MNKLIQLYQRSQNIRGTVISLQPYAILDTPCFPCSFYFGPATLYNNDWTTMDNATSNWYKTLNDAEVAAAKFFVDHPPNV